MTSGLENLSSLYGDLVIPAAWDIHVYIFENIFRSTLLYSASLSTVIQKKET